MACEVWFYHLERGGLDQALPELLEKTLARGWRALVKATGRDRIEHLDGWLWSYRPESFLPHGCDGEPQAERQPILLTCADANVNGAQVLILVDGAQAGPLPGALDPYIRCLVLFDGRDAEAVETARGRWRDVKAAGCEATYWRRSEAGGWRQQG